MLALQVVQGLDQTASGLVLDGFFQAMQQRGEHGAGDRIGQALLSFGGGVEAGVDGGNGGDRRRRRR
ncbi:hypothetical protein GCM10017688_16790 [Streptomyces ramulosus]